MPLFRKKRTGEPSSAPTAGPPAVAPAPATGPPRQAPSSPSGGVSPPPRPTVPSSTPPPLPEPPAPAAWLDVGPDYSECFVCGTTLEGKTCPKCRMTWIE